jgi:CBS domain-containing protein
MMPGAVIADVLRRRRVVVLGQGARVDRAAGLMADKRVGAVLVTEGPRLIGILSERDIVRRVIAAGLDVARTRIGRVMTRAPLFCTPRTLSLKAFQAMRELGVRHLPVMDETGVVGVVAMADIVGSDERAVRSAA